MIVPEAYSVIHQSKQRTPSVFDLHDRGMFKSRPFVTCDWGFRVLVNEDLEAKLEYLALVESSTADPQTGEKFNVVLQSVFIDLNQDLRVKSKALLNHVTDTDVRQQLETAYEEWRAAYVPKNKKGDIDREALKKKLNASITEYRDVVRKNLARKNSAWVQAGLAYQVQRFQRYLYPLVSDGLYEQYQQLGGTDDERGLIRKIAQLQCIYNGDPQDPLRKPDGDVWDHEDEQWECWAGLAGSIEEAKRIGRTLLSGFQPMIVELGTTSAV